VPASGEVNALVAAVIKVTGFWHPALYAALEATLNIAL
jgi:hypothetical protein